MSLIFATQRILFLLFALLFITTGAQEATVVIDETWTDRSTTISSSDVKPQESNVPDSESLSTTLTYNEEATNVDKLSETQTTTDTIASSETVVYNRYATAPSHYDEYTTVENDPEGPPDHVIPYSEHEDAREIPTKPNYTGPGVWAKPPKEKDVPLEFVPTKLYAQVRGTHTVKRVPQEEAVRSAETEEEKESAPRLREVVKNSKVNTIYTEEGYEDSAYDHGGHIRDADFHEGFARKLHEQTEAKKKSKDAKRREEKEKRVGNKGLKELKEFDDYNDDYRDHYRDTPRVEFKKLPEGGEVIEEIHPKFVTENGIEKLEKDLEEEVEKIERESEINQLQNKEILKQQDSHSDEERIDSGSPEKIQDFEDFGRSSSSSKKRKGHQSRKHNARRKTSLRKSVPQKKEDEAAQVDNQHFELYRNDPTQSPEVKTDPQTYGSYSVTGEDPTTVSYEQQFWDFFKSKKNKEVTTQVPSKQDYTTLRSDTVTSLEEAATETPESHSHELKKDTGKVETPSTIETRISRLKNILSKPISKEPVTLKYDQDSNDQWALNLGTNYKGSIKTLEAEPSSPSFTTFTSILSNQGVSDSWQPLSASFGILNPDSAYTNIKAQTNPSESTQVQLQQNIESGTEFLKVQTEQSKSNVVDQPVRGSITESTEINQRPRYKVLVRHKPKKYPAVLLSNQQSVASDFVREARIKEKPMELLNTNGNHAKVLSHVTNENNAKQVQYFPEYNSDYYTQAFAMELDALTRLKPPMPQRVNDAVYPNVVLEYPAAGPIQFYQPSRTIESESRSEPNWQKASPIQEPYYSQYNSMNNKETLVYPVPVPQSMSFSHQRSSIPVTKLVPPSPLLTSDYVKYQPTNVHSDRKGLQKAKIPSKQHRYHTYDGVRMIEITSRRRRAARNESHEIHPVNVKAEIKNSTSNRGKIKAIRNNSETTRRLGIERNSRHRTRRSMMGTVFALDPLNVSSIGKKLKLYMNGNDRVDVSLKPLANQIEGVIINGESTVTGNVHKNLGKNRRSEEIHQTDLILPKVSKHNLINEKNLMSRTESGSIGTGRVKREESRENELKQIATSSRNKNGSRKKSHEELLDESPKITNDVIEKEINSRFASKEEEDQSEEVEREKVEVEVPDFDYVEELVEDDDTEIRSTTETSLDVQKYPFYKNNKISSPALKYVVNPGQRPRKSSGGMEFYQSRDNYKECMEVEPNLEEVLPEEGEPVPDRGLKENLPRLRGLGDKLDCFKAKYFDEHPFDNPLFSEKEVQAPTPPSELDPKQFSSRIMILPDENEEYIVQTGPKTPEFEHAKDENSHQLRNNYSLKSRGRPTTRNNNEELKKSNKNPETAAKLPRLHFSRVQQLNRKPIPLITRNPQLPLHKLQKPRELAAVFETEDPKLHSTKTRQFRKQRENIPELMPHEQVQRQRRKPVSAGNNLSSLYTMTPYESQVYEDVMGNIRHWANSYKVHEELPAEANSKSVIKRPIDPIDPTSDPKMKLRSMSPPKIFNNEGITGEIEVDANIKPVVSNVRDSNPFIEGLIPPGYRERYTDRFARYRPQQKPRAIAQQPPGGSRIIGHYQTIRIHKRSIQKEKNNSAITITEKPSRKMNQDLTDSQHSTNVTDLLADENISIQSHLKDKEVSVASKAKRSKRKSAVRNTSSSISSGEKAKESDKESGRIVHTVRDRIRNSRPKEDTIKAGKFSRNESVTEEDHRRKEPKYNNIRRAKTSPMRSELKVVDNQTNSQSNLRNQDSSRNKRVKSQTDGEVKKAERRLDNYNDEILRITPKVKPEKNAKKESMKHTSKEFIEVTTRKPGRGYAVYEKVDDDISTTTEKQINLLTTSKPVQSRIPSAYDSPKHRESKESSRESSSGESDSREHDKPNSAIKSNDRNRGFSKEASKNNPPSESAESLEAKKGQNSRGPTNRESSREVEDESNGSRSSDEDRSNFWYNSRPSSPAENYEDDKYSHLGPRINKPEFYHPPFKSSNYKKSLDSSAESRSESNGSGEGRRKSNESDDAEREIFPWFRDSSDEKEKRKSPYEAVDSFEYPWERRERLKKERENRKDKYNKSGSVSNEGDEDGDDIVSDGHSEYIYPWDRQDRQKNKKTKRRSVWHSYESDNEDSSSENRPIMRFSSRYKSKSFSLPINEKPESTVKNSVHEISDSVKKAINATINSPVSNDTVDKNFEKRPLGTISTTSRGLSRGTIIPEDVTLRPNGKIDRKKSTKPIRLDHRLSSEQTVPLKREPKRIKLKKFVPDKSEPSPSSDINADHTGNEEKIIKTASESNLRRRRKPSKNNNPTTTESTAVINKTIRRRQKSVPSTTTIVPSTSISTTISSSITTTSAPRTTRRKAVIVSGSPSKGNITNEMSKRGSKSRNRNENNIVNVGQGRKTTEHRSRASKKKAVANTSVPEKEVPSTEKETTSEALGSKTRVSTKKPEIESQGLTTENVEKVTKQDEKIDGGTEGSTIFERHEVKKVFFPATLEESPFSEKSGLKDDIIETVHDFEPSEKLATDSDKDKDNNDRDVTLGSVIKAEVSFSPNGAVKLSEHGSREIISSVSWISEKYTS